MLARPVSRKPLNQKPRPKTARGGGLDENGRWQAQCEDGEARPQADNPPDA